MTGARKSWGVVALLAFSALLFSSCGVGTDSEPRALAPTSTAPTSLPDDAGTATSVIYFLQSELLVPVTRSLPDRTPKAVIESLLVSPTNADGEGLSSSIPASTRLLSASTSEDRTNVDLSADFGDVVGESRNQALGQIVLSITGLPDVTTVTFSLEGEPIKVTTSRGEVSVVTDCDFQTLMADPESSDLRLSPEQLDILNLRVDDLADRCGSI